MFKNMKSNEKHEKEGMGTAFRKELINGLD